MYTLTDEVEWWSVGTVQYSWLCEEACVFIPPLFLGSSTACMLGSTPPCAMVTP